MLRTFATSLLVVLSACGCGGGGSTSSAPVSEDVSPPELVELYGDSLVAGLLNDGSGVIHPPSISAEATLRQAGKDVRVVTLGVGGARMTDLLNGTRLLDTGAVVTERPTWAQRIASSTASVVVINPATNDASNFRPTPASDYRDQLREVIRVAKAAGKVVVIQTPNPVDPAAALATTLDLPLRNQHVASMRLVGAETGSFVCDVDAKAAQANRGMLGDTTDGVHPTVRFNDTFIGPVLAQCIGAVL